MEIVVSRDQVHALSSLALLRSHHDCYGKVTSLPFKFGKSLSLSLCAHLCVCLPACIWFVCTLLLVHVGFWMWKKHNLQRKNNQLIFGWLWWAISYITQISDDLSTLNSNSASRTTRKEIIITTVCRTVASYSWTVYTLVWTTKKKKKKSLEKESSITFWSDARPDCIVSRIDCIVLFLVGIAPSALAVSGWKYSRQPLELLLFLSLVLTECSNNSCSRWKGIEQQKHMVEVFSICRELWFL